MSHHLTAHIPELEGDDSFIQECDEFVAQLQRNGQYFSRDLTEAEQLARTQGQQLLGVSQGPTIQLQTEGSPAPLSERDRQLIRDFWALQERRTEERRAEREARKAGRQIRTRSEERRG